MAIDRLIPRGRPKVAWVDNDPPTEKQEREPFTSRKIAIEKCSIHQLRDPKYIGADIGAVVLTNEQGKLQSVMDIVKTYGASLLDYDCRIFIRSNSADTGTNEIIETIKSLSLPYVDFSAGREPPPPHIRFVELSSSWEEVANFVSLHPSDDAPLEDLHIFSSVELDNSHEILIRRAFRDCHSVNLDAIDDGQSRAQVYKVHAKTSKSRAWAQPYFVKMGSRADIFGEYRNYIENVEPYIPFHLGPNLEQHRCGLGAHTGLIVGDFVDRSESLVACAADGRAAEAISCLFDQTLRMWHRNIENEVDGPLTRIVTLRPNFSPTRLDLARRMGDFHHSPDELILRINRCQGGRWLIGPTHGDLHAKNIRVRSGDAIVIDFFQHRSGVFLLDVARLEASFLVDGFSDSFLGKDGTEYSDSDWLKSIRPLYLVDPTDPREHFEDPASRSYWFHACAKQLRHYARWLERGQRQYAAALAAELLYKARKSPKATGFDNYRRAACYHLADLLLNSNFPDPASAQAEAAE